MLFINPIIGVLMLVLVVFVPIILIFYYYRVGKPRVGLAYIIVGACVLVTLFGLLGRMAFWQSGTLDGNFRVSGTVYSISAYGDDAYQSIVLEDLYIYGDHHSGKLRVNISVKDEHSTLDIAHVGDELRFFGYVSTNKIIDESTGLNLGVWVNDVQYISKVTDTTSTLTHIPHATTGIRLIRLNISNLLDKYLSPQNASIAKAMLLGDTSSMDSDGYSVFSFSGFAHILAVSGMHISIVAAVVGYLLSKLKLKKVLIFLLTLGVVMFYVWLADFSPSALRAVLMFCVFSFSTLRYKWYDGMNSLGFAATILLLFKPLYLFNVSFILSFGAVLGINLFYRSIYKFIYGNLSKRLVPSTVTQDFRYKYTTRERHTLSSIKWFSQVLAIGFAVQIVSVVLTAFIFHRFAVYSTIASLFINPILFVVFVGLVLIVPIAYFIPLLGFLLIPINFVMDIFVGALTFVADLPYSSIYVWVGLPLVFLILVALCAASRYIMHNRTRVAAGVASVLLYTTMFVFGTPRGIRYSNAIIPMQNNATMVVDDDKTAYFGAIDDKASQYYRVLDFRVTHIDSMYISDDSYINASSLNTMRRNFGIDTFYVPVTSSVTDIAAMRRLGLKFRILNEADVVDFGSFKISTLIEDNVFLGYQLLSDETNILMTSTNTTLNKLGVEMLQNYNILRSSYAIDYRDAVQIVDSSFIDAQVDLVFVSYDRPKAYFDFGSYTIKSMV